MRRLLEAAARERPVMAVLDDAHWAEPMLARPHRVHRDVLGLVADPPALPGAARTARDAPRLGGPAAEPRRSSNWTALEDPDAHALVAAIAGDELRRRRTTSSRSPRAIRCSWSSSRRCPRSSIAATLPPSIEAVLARTHRSPRAGRADGAGARVRRGPAIPLRRRRRADGGCGSATSVAASLMGLARKQLIRPDQRVSARGGRVQVRACADPRGGVRGACRSGCARNCTSASRTGCKRGNSPSTPSSDTTSSRRIGSGSSSSPPATASAHWQRRRRSGWRRPRARRARPRRRGRPGRASSSAPSRCFRKTTSTGRRCCRRSGARSPRQAGSRTPTGRSPWRSPRT